MPSLLEKVLGGGVDSLKMLLQCQEENKGKTRIKRERKDISV